MAKTVTEVLNDLPDDATADQLIEALGAEVKALGGLQPLQALQALERYVTRVVEQVGMLALQIAEETGTLPEGFEAELINLRKSFLVHRLASILEVGVEGQGGGLLVPQQGIVVPK